MNLLGVRAGLVVFLVALGGRAQDAGSEDAGAGVCHDTAECAPPKPYCDTARSVCVQCQGDANCLGIGGFCDTTLGVCAVCRTGADCYGQTPYCSRALNRCVECVSDGNCGKLGIKCVDGLCGSCGDGICSPKERSAQFGLCSDCYAGCPAKDLKSGPAGFRVRPVSRAFPGPQPLPISPMTYPAFSS